jgi:moderate conductance mechanosensitive channel
LPHQTHLITTITVALATIAAAYLLSRLINFLVPRLARILGALTHKVSRTENILAIKRVETYLGVAAAVARALLFGLTIYVIWVVASPATGPVAIFGASAVVAIIASSTIGPLLRDVAFGTIMIAEGWYNVGDHIVVEPFANLSGVVEQLTPRATKLRSLSGEVIWLHNQNIQGARVTSRGVKTIALDVFVTDPEAGKKVINKAIRTVPTGPTMLAGEFEITEVEELGTDLWRINITGATMPGREWLIEDFAIKAITKYDQSAAAGPTIVHGPIAHYADAMAERRFKRSLHLSS